jgi:sphingomyelin phosphodiesterase acid-like 3
MSVASIILTWRAFERVPAGSKSEIDHGDTRITRIKPGQESYPWHPCRSVVGFYKLRVPDMRGRMKMFRLWGWMVACLAFVWMGTACAQPTVTAVMLSDLHFDPFHDPGKVALLLDAPISRWDAILSGPDTPGAAEQFAAVGKKCGARGVDTPYPLLDSSLAAAHASGAGARFVMVVGDDLVHTLACRFGAILPDRTARAPEFAMKTSNYVMRRIQTEFPGLPIYFALGNNDVECANSRLDLHDALFAATSKALFAGMRGVSGRQKRRALRDYLAGGNYSVTMAAPMRGTRLIELDDFFMVDFKYYANCANVKDPAGAERGIAWLTRQLDDARRRHERVWLLTHIPPGLDTYNTFAAMKDICVDGDSTLYLGSERLSAVLERYPDVIQLVVSGHSHGDEFHLLHAEGGDIPLKMFGSISPINGNMPSFTIAAIAPATSSIADYTVFTASNQTGLGTTWSREYSFDATFHEPAFSKGALADLIGKFHADPTASTPLSRDFENFYYEAASSGLSPLESVWPRFVCMMDHETKAGYKSCVCPAK